MRYEEPARRHEIRSSWSWGHGSRTCYQMPRIGCTRAACPLGGPWSPRPRFRHRSRAGRNHCCCTICLVGLLQQFKTRWPRETLMVSEYNNIYYINSFPYWWQRFQRRERRIWGPVSPRVRGRCLRLCQRKACFHLGLRQCRQWSELLYNAIQSCSSSRVAGWCKVAWRLLNSSV